MLAPMHEPGNELIRRVASLAPLLREHAAASERLRHPSDEVIDALRNSGLFELMVPRIYGGLELDLDVFLEAVLLLAEGDISAAWVAGFYIEHNWILCQFPAAFQSDLFEDRSHVLAPASIAPNGIAEPVPGGYRLNGRWQWGTGVWHAEWAIAGARIRSSDAHPDNRFFALPRSDFELVDTWNVDGLCGTGSHDIEIHDAVVPAERTVSMLEMANGIAPGSKVHSAPLYRTPMLPILALTASAPAVGMVRAMLRQAQEDFPKRGSSMGAQRPADRPSIQIRLARAKIAIEQAESLLRSIVNEVCEERAGATPAQRSRWLASAAMAVDQSRKVLLSIAEVAGASTHFLSHPLQRAVRDINTLASHTIFDLDQRLESYGRTLVGLKPQGLY